MHALITYRMFMVCFVCFICIAGSLGTAATSDDDVDWFSYYLDHHLGAEPFSYTGMHAPTFDYSDFIKTPTISANPEMFRSPGTGTNISTSAASQNTGFMITSSPAGADVSLNGEYKGKTRTLNSLKLFGLESGPYEVTVSYPGYRSFTHTYLLYNNQVVRIDVNLTPLGE